MTLGRAALYLATAAGLGLLLRTLLKGPVPLWIALGAFFAYLAVAAAGVFFPRLQMFTRAVSRGSSKVPRIALTFDDGPHPVHTPKVLDALERAGARATFFVIGCKVQDHPEIAAEIVRRGHEIGIHSLVHDRLLAARGSKRIVADLEATREAVRKATGQTPMLFRPPVGVTSPRIEEAVNKLDLTVVAWSVRGYDGLRGARPDRVARRIAASLRPGSIVLMHDAAERGDEEPAGVSALPAVLEAIASTKLEAVGVSELIEQEGT